MKKTRLSQLLDIEYPIIQGAMTLISGAELAAAVSNAGGLGIIVFNAAGRDPERFRAEIRRCRHLTDRPFGVNFSVGEDTAIEYIMVAIEEGVAVATTSAGDPSLYTGLLRDAGVKVLHLVGSVRHARRAVEAGVDAVIAEGFEAGGHNASDEITTMALVPQVAAAVEVPVVAAGGIADGRGLVAALALGADGVQVGTRFIATQECAAHPAFKEAVLRADDRATVITQRRWWGPARILRNSMAQVLIEMENSCLSAEEAAAYFGRGRAIRGQMEGDLEEGELFCGEIAGLVKDLLPAGEVVRRIVEEAKVVAAGVQVF